ncbi:redoxin domain-containing protein [Zunongwangia sp.]|uniref:redoxin domain-containing protein n=1 Tax=Zunongwangia sp. TaxID=1965325 RepID=UPI003AA7F5F6
MRKLIGIASLMLVFAGCQNNQGYSVSGTAKGIENGKKVYVSELSELGKRPERTDSTTVENGKFQINLGKAETPNLSYLEFEGKNGSVLYIAENENIEFTVYKDSLQASTRDGGKQNELLNEYLQNLKDTNKEILSLRKEMGEAYQKQDTATLNTLQDTQQEIIDNANLFKKQIAKENKDAFVSVMAVIDLLKAGDSISELQEIFDSLNENIKQTALGKKVGEQLTQANATKIGNKAPSFSAPTPEGEELALEDVLGEVTIVDFWASWCKPCRKENPNFVKLYKKYHDKGLNMISISLDQPNQKEKWVEAIEEDGLGEWNHISNLKYWQDPIARKYNIQGIPATFILDKNGIIVDKDLRGEELDAKIGELLGEKS